MTSWIIRSIGGLVIFSGIGAAGGSINYLNNKQETIEDFDIEEPEMELQTQEIEPKKETDTPVVEKKRGPFIGRREPRTVSLPKGVRSCDWLYYNGYKKIRSKGEANCKKFAKNQLGITFVVE